MPKRNVIFACCIIGLSSLPLRSEEAPPIQQVAAAGKQTLSRLESEVAAWTTVVKMPDSVESHVKVICSPMMRRITIGAGQDEVLTIIERDGYPKKVFATLNKNSAPRMECGILTFTAAKML